jgi:hypothetical protein
MKKIIFLFSIISVGFTNAQNVFQDDFGSYTTGMQLSGQGAWSNNSSLPGGGGGCAGFGCPNSKVIATALNYADYGNASNSVELKPDLDTAGRGFASVSGNDIYFGVVVNLTSATVTSSFDLFRLSTSTGNFNPAFKVLIKSASGGFVVGISKGSSGTSPFATTVLPFGSDHLIVVKYTKSTGDDMVSLFLDPVFIAGEPATPILSTTNGVDQTGNIDRISIRQNTSNGIPTGRYGLVSVAATWSDLAFPNLATDTVNATNFKVLSNNAKTGALSIDSNANFENIKVTIFDIQGKIIQTKIVSLMKNINEISINPIQNSGIYIVEIIANEKKYTQKISVN